MSQTRSGVVALVAAVAIFAAGIAALAWIREPSRPSLRVGSVAPEFTLRVSGGPDAELAALRGRVVFVNFWATWCPPCREEAPSLERLYVSLREEGFEVLGISIDSEADEAAVERFAQEFGLTFPVPRDPGKRVYGAYQVSGVPETFLVDRDGRVLERFVGPQNWDDPRYARAIRNALASGRRSGSEEGSGGS